MVSKKYSIEIHRFSTQCLSLFPGNNPGLYSVYKDVMKSLDT